ncbi:MULTISPECIES: hypothetical protein [Actinosynnema]|uniref:hypothetical protein n=1 Tax=Actinosynnema TaxID=40566 RepID=UPI002646A474|nr:hypothetical protein [Actinosynnema pretiosum]MCP2092547.1 hypothetical protein [Actinosynnema pretiosum]
MLVAGGAVLTNEEFYESVGRAAQGVERSLEEYLRTLWHLARAERARQELPAEVALTLLVTATTAPAPPFDPSWRTADLSVAEGTSEFDVWERVIQSQVADLRDLAEGPELYYPELGVDAPRPENCKRATAPRWYNHRVESYLECAIAGALGGWDPEGAARVPEGAARVRVQGEVTPLHPEPEGVRGMTVLSWLDLTEVLVCGQEYE